LSMRFCRSLAGLMELDVLALQTVSMQWQARGALGRGAAREPSFAGITGHALLK